MKLKVSSHLCSTSVSWSCPGRTCIWCVTQLGAILQKDGKTGSYRVTDKECLCEEPGSGIVEGFSHFFGGQQIGMEIGMIFEGSYLFFKTIELVRCRVFYTLNEWCGWME